MSAARGGAVAGWIVFAVTGMVSATWAARISDIQQRLHLSSAGLGLAVLAVEGGALVGLPAGGWLVARRGPRWCLCCAFAVYPTLLVPVALASSPWWLSAALAGWALTNSVIDVAMNTVGVELQARSGRPLLSRLHAGQTVGLLVGGGCAAAAAAAGISLPAHYGAVAAAGAVAGLTAAARLPRTVPAAARPGRAGPHRRLFLLGAVAFCAFLIDGGASTWSSVDLRVDHHATAAVAAAGYTGMVLAIAAVRLAGDRLLTRARPTRILRACGVIAAAGTVVVVLAPATGVALAGWALLGAGLGVLAPTVLGAAPDQHPAVPPATAIATVTTIGYLGSFTGPPLIAALSNLVPLSDALMLLALAATTIAVLAPRALATHPHRGVSPAAGRPHPASESEARSPARPGSDGDGPPPPTGGAETAGPTGTDRTTS